ncbi:MAG: hemolysin III family protein [Actinobacteria bacterium]|nr:hemolysin III family protein [Actinomycetota bacterium]
MRANHLDPSAPRPKLRGILHLVSAPIALIAGLVVVFQADSMAMRIACIVYLFTAVNLFTVSATYHIGRWSVPVKTTLRRVDHSNIFLIIAGTYTPLSIALLAWDSAKTLLIIIWVAAALGVAISLIWPHAPRWISVPLYLAMGWVSIFYVPEMAQGNGLVPVILIAIGGLLYSLGAVVYGLKKPNISLKWFGFHELFHSFTVAAFAVHFIAVTIAVIQ